MMFLRAVGNERKRRQELGASSQVDKVRFQSQMFQNVKYEAAIPDGSFQVPVGAKNQDTVEFTSSDQDISQQTASRNFHLHNYLHLCLQPLPINPSSKQTLHTFQLLLRWRK